MSKTTRRMRHAIVRTIAPKLYRQAIDYKALLIHIQSATSGVPRPAILFLSRQQSNELVGAEIAVSKALNAESIMETLKIKRLYLIDPYQDSVESGLFFKRSSEKGDAIRRMEKYGSKVQFLNLPAHDAKQYINESLDFVYVDGRHDYEHVKQDIEDYSQKLVRGGMLCGHDFCIDYPDVIAAVTEFSVGKHLRLFIQGIDWWMFCQ
jgi:hypothetical protein